MERQWFLRVAHAEGKHDHRGPQGRGDEDQRRLVRALRATETITVIIPRATPGTWYQMDACLRAPGLPQQQAQISSMLRSVRIAKGD